MTPGERDLIMAGLLAIWPTPKMSAGTEVAWVEFFTPLDFERVRALTVTLQRKHKKRPSMSDYWDLYSGADAQHPLAEQCGDCDDGWVWVARDTVARCPNGCLPLTHEQRQAKNVREDREYADGIRTDAAIARAAGTTELDF